MKKNILITGATDGIGLETAKMLATGGHSLMLHGRSEEKLKKAKDEVCAVNADAVIKTYVSDFADLNSVKRMAQDILKENSSIDVIINNAGVFVEGGNPLTKDGYDLRFSVNTIAPYVLTKILLPAMNTDGRVVNLSSAAQATVDFASLANHRVFSANDGYAQSKLAITMWSMSLAETHPSGPIFIAVNPKSFLGSKMVKVAYGREGYDLRIGADVLCRAAISDEFADANGKYFDNDYGVFSDPHPFAMEECNRKKLIEILEVILINTTNKGS